MQPESEGQCLGENETMTYTAQFVHGNTDCMVTQVILFMGHRDLHAADTVHFMECRHQFLYGRIFRIVQDEPAVTRVRSMGT